MEAACVSFLEVYRSVSYEAAFDSERCEFRGLGSCETKSCDLVQQLKQNLENKVCTQCLVGAHLIGPIPSTSLGNTGTMSSNACHALNTVVWMCEAR